MKAISASLKTHLSLEVTSLCTCWELHCKDGSIQYFTDLDIPFMFGGNKYLPAVGYNKTAVSGSSDMSVDSLDVVGLLDDASITKEDLRAGRYNFAQFRIFIVNWQDLTMGILRMKRGWLGEVLILPNGTFKAELRALNQAFTQTIGDVTSPECRADLGDSKCKLAIDSAAWARTGAVINTSDRANFIYVITDVAGEDPRASDDSWYRGGVLTWTSGTNVGRSIEVKSSTFATKAVQLFLPMGTDIQLGDNFIIRPGCDKRRQTCVNKFGNVVNMRAEPFKPGQDLLSNYPNMPFDLS